MTRARRKTISSSVRAAIFERDGGRCRYCRSMTGPFHIDHVIPHSWNGGDHPSNLVLACRSCNLRKRDRVWEPLEAEGGSGARARRALLQKMAAELGHVLWVDEPKIWRRGRGVEQVELSWSCSCGVQRRLVPPALALRQIGEHLRWVVGASNADLPVGD